VGSSGSSSLFTGPPVRAYGHAPSLWATNRRTSTARPADSRWSVPSIRRRLASAKSRDDELNDIILAKLADEHIYVQMSLDKSQAGGVHEKELLAKWQNDLIGNSIAIGESTKGAISHMKIVIVDGVYTVRGSTNWSLAGEQKQDNELTIHNNAVIAAETRAELDRNHDAMLKQMAAVSVLL
jgi:phosphatidylserine/phosphatidylglycerophosphate/cardiolipin synthase-like enzyme